MKRPYEVIPLHYSEFLDLKQMYQSLLRESAASKIRWMRKILGWSKYDRLLAWRWLWIRKPLWTQSCTSIQCNSSLHVAATNFSGKVQWSAETLHERHNTYRTVRLVCCTANFCKCCRHNNWTCRGRHRWRIKLTDTEHSSRISVQCS